MSKKSDQDKLKLLLGFSALTAVVVFPLTTISAAMGGYAGYKVGNKIAQEKYGPRDVGGAFPAALLTLSMAFGSAAVTAYGVNYAIDSIHDARAPQENVLIIDQPTPNKPQLT